MSVNGAGLNGIKQLFREFNTDHSVDENGNATLDRQEIAQAAIELHERGDEVSLTQASILATFVVPRGENHPEGLFPDYDGDHLVSTEELEELAAEAGDRTAFESDDFGVAFPDRGPQAEYKVSDLERIAAETPEDSGTDPEAGCGCDSAENGGGGQETPDLGTLVSGFAELFIQFIRLMTTSFSR